MQRQMHTKAQQLREQIATIDTEITSRKAQLTRLLEAFEIGSIPKDLLKQRADEYRALLDELEPRKEVLEQELAGSTISDEEIRALIGTLEEYRQQLQDDWRNADFETQRAVIAALGLYFVVESPEGLCIKWLYNKFRVAMQDTNMAIRSATPC